MNDQGLFYNAASSRQTKVAKPIPKTRAYTNTKPTDVYLFGTCVIDLFFPGAGLDAIKLLEKLDIKVHYPQEQSCCGQAAYSSGFDTEARKVALAQMEAFSENPEWLIVVPSGSCGGMMYHHYVELFENEAEILERAIKFSERIFELTEFLLHVCKVQLDDKGNPIKIALHTSCAARREMNVHLHARSLLTQLKHVERIDHDHESECCGFGGTFSIKMAEINGAMVQRKTLALKETNADEVISADCGCLMNIMGSFEKQQIQMPGRHIASFLLERIEG